MTMVQKVREKATERRYSKLENEKYA